MFCVLTDDMRRGARCGRRARRAPPLCLVLSLDGAPTACARTRQGRRGWLVGRVSLGVDQGRGMERVHLILDEGSVRYRRPTLRRLGERSAIWALPYRAHRVKIAKSGDAGVRGGRTET